MTAPPLDLVVDASVAIKWFVPEAHSEAALRFMTTAFAMHVPSFFAAECGNTIWKKVAQRREIEPDKGRDVLEKLLDSPQQIHDAASLIPLAFELAIHVGNVKMAIYDFTYLALAEELDCRLVTADRAFYEALQFSPYKGRLRWVEDSI